MIGERAKLLQKLENNNVYFTYFSDKKKYSWYILFNILSH